MKYYSTLLFLFLVTSFVSAQDTIVKRNDEKIVAKILEVNPDNIKYKRFDYLDGPVFLSDKSELKYIAYQNGTKESYENYVPPVTKIYDTIKVNAFIKPNLLIQPTGRNYYYKSMKITEPDMLDVAGKLNDKKINLMIEQVNKKRILQKSFLYGGMVVGTVGLLTFAGIITAFNPSVNNVNVHGRNARRAATAQRRQTGGYIMLGGIACEIASVTFKIQRLHHAHIVVDAYNKQVSQ
jgi:hypothetical protein